MVGARPASGTRLAVGAALLRCCAPPVLRSSWCHDEVVSPDPSAILRADYLEWLRELARTRPFGAGDRLGTANLIDGAAHARGARRDPFGSSGQPRPAPRAGEEPARATIARCSPSRSSTPTARSGPVPTTSSSTATAPSTPISTGSTTWASTARGTAAGRCRTPPRRRSSEFAGAGLFTRGIHVDVPAVRGTPWVDIDEPVTGDDLDRALAASGATFEPGDALLLDMGRDRFESAGHVMGGPRRPGIGFDGARWLVDHGVSVLCWDFMDALPRRRAARRRPHAHLGDRPGARRQLRPFPAARRARTGSVERGAGREPAADRRRDRQQRQPGRAAVVRRLRPRRRRDRRPGGRLRTRS